MKFADKIYFALSYTVTAVFKLENELIGISHNSFLWTDST